MDATAGAMRVDVRFWHIADVPLALTNVCFEGKNGHDADRPLCPLMTQAGLEVPVVYLFPRPVAAPYSASHP
jgi:hypothetical protein